MRPPLLQTSLYFDQFVVKVNTYPNHALVIFRSNFMKRLIDYHLQKWKNNPYRQPLLIRGARQVGKTYAVRELGKSYQNFVEINLESNRRAHAAFEKDLDPKKILFELSAILKTTIHPQNTLLFLDEIQAKPDAITALRYFYEEMPELHIIAAGSLLDFAIEKVGIPVGRVQSLYMYPLSFIEFLAALGEHPIIQAILKHDPTDEMSTIIHEKTLELVAKYLALGGMPKVVQRWQEAPGLNECTAVHSAIIDSYRQDFGKYARQAQIKYVDKIFDHVPMQIGRKFKYNAIDGDYRKRELSPALDLLVTAGVIHKNYHSSGQGIPLGAQIDFDDYKIVPLDVGISQAIAGLDLAQWFLNPLVELINKGPLVEAFVGQEILCYQTPHRKKDLFYWHRESKSSQAEVDYLIQKDQAVIPIEVKGGSGRTLKSMQMFLDTHKASPYGIRFSTHNYSVFDKVHSYPLYAIANGIMSNDAELTESLLALI